ncbi:tyrosine-type recombinase/integrase [Halopiger djelfimassiliensis]|uniref:tyrosine-type recombinase/integrase n=1 Tax=Halopiger djelfimassiliensis TaxID=1293047 RepID=UPI000678036A|nr:site-specific integrase [Halopiger djelfimassiliensis]
MSGTNPNGQLEPLDPSEALELYIADRQTDGASEATLRSHRSRLGHFLDWCEAEDIDNLNDLTGRDLQRYKVWRSDFGINRVTLKTQLDTLRVFIRWCESVDAVTNDLSESIVSPNLTNGENSRDEMLDTETAEAALDWHRRYQYASEQHVVLRLAWRTWMRRGAIRALDLDDYHPDEEYVEVVHRPESDTPIKNKEAGERHVALDTGTCTILNDYLNQHRHDVTDDHGRNPLITTPQGRPHVQTIQTWVYAATRPCQWGDCPDDRDPDECGPAVDRSQSSSCPASVSPHPVRRGGITHALREEVPIQVVSDRANASAEVLEEHYSQLTNKEKMEQRRDYLDNL